MRFSTFAFTLLLAAAGQAKIVTRTVSYHDGGTVMEGYMAYDDAKAKRPCVLICHDWDGLNAYEKGRAEERSRWKARRRARWKSASNSR